MNMEGQRRCSSSPQASQNGKWTLRSAAPVAGLLNVLYVAVLYLCALPLFALATSMKTALRLLLALARGPIQVSQWVGRRRLETTTCSSVLSSSTVLVLRIVQMFLAFTRKFLRKPFIGARPAKPMDRLEDKIEILTQQLHLYRTRLENVEQLASSAKASPEHASPTLPSYDLRRRSICADRRRSYPEEYSASLKRMLAEARAVTGSEKRQSYVYCDSPTTDSASSCSDQSMPPTPTLIPSRRITSRQEKRRSAGLKPLLLPSVLAFDSTTNSPPARYMYRMSWHRDERLPLGIGCDEAAIPIAEEDEEIPRCDTPCRMKEDLDMDAAQFVSTESPVCLEGSRGSNGLNFVMTLPTIPSKRQLSSVEA